MVFFSANWFLKECILNILIVLSPHNTGRYRGLPSLFGKSERQVFSLLWDRIRQRLQGRQGKLLSQVDKEILIKAVWSSHSLLPDEHFFGSQKHYVRNCRRS